MQMQTGIRALNETLDNARAWLAEHEARRDAWSAGTEGAALPALVGFRDSLATVRRELDAAAGSVEALERLRHAIGALGDEPERARYIGPHNAALGALERRLGPDGPVLAAINETLRRVEPAGAEAEAEIDRRLREAAQQEAARREAEECRKAGERKRTALAAAARAGAISEVEAALAAEAAPADGLAG